MNLKGKQVFSASPQQIWNILMDADKLAKITPGVSKLEKTAEDTYNAISDVKIGPVKGSFSGDLQLENKNEPNQFTLQVKQKSKIGNADASVDIHLAEIENGTELSFDGKAKLSGTLARTGQRVLSGVANTLTKQFFKGLEEELSKELVVEEAPGAPTEKIPPPTTKPGILARFLAWIKKLFR